MTNIGKGVNICGVAVILIVFVSSRGAPSVNQTTPDPTDDEYYDELSETGDNLDNERKQLAEKTASASITPVQSHVYPYMASLGQPQTGDRLPATRINPEAFYNIARPVWAQPIGNGVPVNANIAQPTKYTWTAPASASAMANARSVVTNVHKPQPQPQPQAQAQAQPQKPLSVEQQPYQGQGPMETNSWQTRPQQPFAPYPNFLLGSRLVVLPSVAGTGGMGMGRGVPLQPMPTGPYAQSQMGQQSQIQRPPYFPSQISTPRVDNAEVASQVGSSSKQFPAQYPTPATGQVRQPVQVDTRFSFSNIRPAIPQSIPRQSNPNPSPVSSPVQPAVISSKPSDPSKHDQPKPSSPFRSIGVSTPHGKMLLEPYHENYCDMRRYDDQTLAGRSLQRVEYFIANLTCSRYFFECAIGQTFLLNCTSKDQVFDIDTINCNFKYNVKSCSEYDHVLHCSIREECKSDQFACCSPPQQCIPFTKRCDGVVDCADGDDENNCPACNADEFACVKSGKCIAWEKRCNGIPDECLDQTNLDESNCAAATVAEMKCRNMMMPKAEFDRFRPCFVFTHCQSIGQKCDGCTVPNFELYGLKKTHCFMIALALCPPGKFLCSRSSEAYSRYPVCIDTNLRCNGVKECPAGDDELNCKSKGAKYLLCENQRQSVFKEQWCDGYEDCMDGSDEKYCIY